jgi:hypothetical protein
MHVNVDILYNMDVIHHLITRTLILSNCLFLYIKSSRSTMSLIYKSSAPSSALKNPKLGDPWIIIFLVRSRGPCAWFPWWNPPEDELFVNNARWFLSRRDIESTLLDTVSLITILLDEPCTQTTQTGHHHYYICLPLLFPISKENNPYFFHLVTAPPIF